MCGVRLTWVQWWRRARRNWRLWMDRAVTLFGFLLLFTVIALWVHILNRAFYGE